MALKGMDVEQVQEFGQIVRNDLAVRVDDLRTQLQHRAQSLNWEGPDAQEFIGNRVAGVVNQLGQLRTQLEEYADLAVKNAQAQADVSAVL